MSGIPALNPLAITATAANTAAHVQPAAGSDSFGKFLTEALNQVNELQAQAEQAGVDLAAGKSTDIHNVMIATEKANLAVELTVQVRNKVIDAYQEIMRMQI